MNYLFSLDSPFISFMSKLVDLMILNIIWLICCIPVVTVIPATTALYYAVVKVIRRDRGHVVKEFFHSFKQNLLQGLIFSVIACVLIYMLHIDFYYLIEMAGHTVGDSVFSGLIIVLSVVLLAIYMYICPVLSRFGISSLGLIKISFGMALTNLSTTIALVLITAAVVLGCMVFMPGICLFPAAGTLLASFLLEKILKKYLPANESDENETGPNGDAWYRE